MKRPMKGCMAVDCMDYHNQCMTDDMKTHLAVTQQPVILRADRFAARQPV